ncbi:RNA polymerase sigma factor [Sphingobium sp. CR2-8]|uniref:RNA polymerase sigma factor n=1 Tax=Sphingobium sp. CR2-8 TaxID=1306534 RepID=UPI002DBF5ACA|nr:RNA polymerase sigma factor [Sphingobium sp. CR2-8]MEC3912416.1 RNA polymerase sigma factor [Sphingobium sp. CR2-8]
MARWVGREILPHERDLRNWLRRQVVAAADVEDVVQECYCRLAQLPDVAHVTAPRAYLFTMARNIVRRQRERARVVRLDPLSDLSGEGESDLLTPERFAQARQELGRVQTALAMLSDRARRIFIMRKVEGLSQKAIAQALGVSETIVENEASRGLRTLLRQLTEPEATSEQPFADGGLHARNR